MRTNSVVNRWTRLGAVFSYSLPGEDNAGSNETPTGSAQHSRRALIVEMINTFEFPGGNQLARSAARIVPSIQEVPSLP